MTRATVERWRSVIRIFAVTIALLGVVLVGNEIWENISSCAAGACVRIHLSTMLWGMTLMAFGLLILQRGDVSVSLQELRTTGDAVAGWFGRRAYDRRRSKAVVAAVTDETAIVAIAPDPAETAETEIPTDLPTRRDD